MESGKENLENKQPEVDINETKKPTGSLVELMKPLQEEYNRKMFESQTKLRTMEVKNLEQLDEFERTLEEYKNSIDLEDKSNGE